MSGPPAQYKTCLLLCGGKSSRMGQPKGLLDYFGRPWLVEQLYRLKKVGMSSVTVLLGYGSDEYFVKIPQLRQVGASRIDRRGVVIEEREDSPFWSGFID